MSEYRLAANQAELADAVGIHPRHILGRNWAGGPPTNPSIAEICDAVDRTGLPETDAEWDRGRALARQRDVWSTERIYREVNRALSGVNLTLATKPNYAWQSVWTVKALEPGAWAWAAREIVVNSLLFQDDGYISDMARRDHRTMPPHVFVEEYLALLKTVSAVCSPRYDDEWYLEHVILNWSDPRWAVYAPQVDRHSGRVLKKVLIGARYANILKAAGFGGKDGGQQ